MGSTILTFWKLKERVSITKIVELKYNLLPYSAYVPDLATPDLTLEYEPWAKWHT